MRSGLGPILGRIAAIVGGLLFVGIVLRLLVAILSPVLPAELMQIVMSGWDLLLGIAGPALVPIAAVGILAALVWAFGRRR